MMETDKKNGEENSIDEDYLMSIMAGSTKKESANTKPITSDETHLPKSKNKAKKNNDFKYVEQFLTHHSMNKRGDKSIYIRAEYHERLSRIIQIVADDQIPLYAYLDNILAHHFEMFEKEITEDFNNKYRPIF
jgi:capsule polysaccharide export protein KpsE/RkpR